MNRPSLSTLLRNLRPHYVGTYIAMLPAGIVMVLLIVPGTTESFVPGISETTTHGWPWEFMKSQVTSADNLLQPVFEPESIWPKWLTDFPWARGKAWQLNGQYGPFQIRPLIGDLVVGLACIIPFGVLYELWRKRRQSAWQFTLVDMLSLVTLVAMPLGYLAYHRHLHQLEAEAEKIALDNSTLDQVFQRTVLSQSIYEPYSPPANEYLRYDDHFSKSPYLQLFERRTIHWNDKLLSWQQQQFFSHPQQVCFNGEQLKSGSDGHAILRQLLSKYPGAVRLEICDFDFDDALADILVDTPRLNEIILSGTTLSLSSIPGDQQQPTDAAEPSTVSLEKSPQEVSRQLHALGRLQELPNLHTPGVVGDLETSAWKAIGTLPHLHKVMLRGVSLNHAARGLNGDDLRCLGDQRLFLELEVLDVSIDENSDSRPLSKLANLKRLTLRDTLNDSILDAISDLPALEEFNFISHYTQKRYKVDLLKLTKLPRIARTDLSSQIDCTPAQWQRVNAALPNADLRAGFALFWDLSKPDK